MRSSRDFYFISASILSYASQQQAKHKSQSEKRGSGCARPSGDKPTRRLEIDASGELQITRTIVHVGRNAKSAGAGVVSRLDVRQAHTMTVKGIDRFDFELELHPLRECKILEQAEVFRMIRGPGNLFGHA